MSGPTPKPTALAPLPENLPDRLTAGNTFLVWNWWWDAKRSKWTKPPLSARSGYRTAINNAANGVDFATAIDAMRRRNHDGIGRMLFRGDHLVGWDLDGCRDSETGAVATWAQEIVNEIDSYTEISPSGTGLRILADGELDSDGNKAGDVEVYCDGRYLTLTGHHLPGTPRTVEPRQAEIDAVHALHFPPAPPTPKAPRADRKLNPDVDDGHLDIDDEPPVALSPQALEVWHGHRRAMKDGQPGLIDQSETFWWIACDLWEHGATQKTIISALAERDIRFGWNRYIDRPKEYRRLAAKVSSKPRKVGPIGTSAPHSAASSDEGPSSNDEPCDIRLGRAIAQLDQVRAERDDLARTVDTLRVRIQLADHRLATYQNPGLGSAKAVASGLIQIFAAETPAKPNTPTGYRVPLGKLADITGLSEDACSRQIKQLAKYTLPDSETPVIHYTVASVGGVDRETGEIIAPHKEMWIGPGVAVNEFAEVLATLNPAAKPKWGGVTECGTCANHPDDGVIQRVRYQKTVTYECATCNHVLQEQTTPVASTRSTAKHLTRIPTPHDAAQQPVNDPELDAIPQDANSINRGHHGPVGDIYTGKMRHRAEPVTRSLFDVLTPEEIAAGLSVYAQGMKPTPLDQFTVGDDPWTR